MESSPLWLRDKHFANSRQEYFKNMEHDEKSVHKHNSITYQLMRMALAEEVSFLVEKGRLLGGLSSESFIDWAKIYRSPRFTSAGPLTADIHLNNA